MKNKQISLFTKPLTNTVDLSQIELKLKLLNRMRLNKSHETHDTHQKLYNTLYESITLDQEALDALDAEPSFKSSRGWFKKKSGSVEAANRRTTWIDFLLKSSTVAMEKKLNELIQKDKLTIVALEGAGLEKLKKQYNNDVELEYHVDQLKATMLTEAQWNNGTTPKEYGRQNFFKEEINNWSPDKVYSDKKISSVVRVDVKRKLSYGYLSSIVVRRSDKKEYEFSYADLPKLNLNDIEDMYLLKFQDKLHHL
ncbi:hypothetical protein Tco_1119157 [Tanacetum coccineum]